MNKLGFNKFTDEEEIELQHGLKQSFLHAESVIEKFKKASIIPRSTTKLIQKKTKKIFKSKDIDSDDYINTKYVKVTALRVEMRELKYLYEIGFLQYYTYMSMNILLQRERDVIASKPSDKKNTKIKPNPFIKFENELIKQLRELDFASSILSRYQHIRFSQSLQRNIAGLLICKKVIHEINGIDNIDGKTKEIVVEEYQQRLARRQARVEDIAKNFPEFYSRFEVRLFEKVSLFAANSFIKEAYSNHEVCSKVFTNIKERIAEAIDEIPQITEAILKLKPRDILAMVPLLEGLSSEILDQLSNHATTLTFLQGDQIIGQDEKGDALYIITHGQVKIYKTGYEHEPIAELSSGDFFGEMALLGEQIRTANAKADRPSSLLRLNRKDVLLMAEKEPELKERLENAAEGRSSI
jgi:hypothetical protein